MIAPLLTGAVQTDNRLFLRSVYGFAAECARGELTSFSIILTFWTGQVPKILAFFCEYGILTEKEAVRTETSELYEVVRFEDAAVPLKAAHAVLPAGYTGALPADFLPHWHEHLELHWFLRGGAQVLTGDEWVTAETGDVTVVNPSELHGVLPGETDSEYWFLIISPHMLGSGASDAYGDFWKRLAGQTLRFSHVVRDDAAVQAEMAAMVREYTAREPGYELALRGHLFALLTILTRHYGEKQPSALARRQDQRIKDVLRLIGERYAQPLSPRMLAEHCGLELAYFCRLFRRATGMTAAEYITAYRLSKAEELLLGTGLSVTAVAEKSGFEDVSYFSRCFKRSRGISPLRFRRQELNNKE